VKKKALGERGSWFATVDGERLPCVHQHWITGTRHCDPHVRTDGKWPNFIEAIEAGKKVIVTKDDVTTWTRTGYVAVFRVENVVVDETGLCFDLAERLDELK
jgi:hypothetical protein